MKVCSHCKQNLPKSDYYIWNNKIWPYCKKCESYRKKQQLLNFKKSCLSYKNQHCCSICGYDKCITALDFHHVDPNQKEFTISSSKKMLLDEKIKSELDKCDVVCSNCHRELHAVENGEFSPNILQPKSLTYCIDCSTECDINAQRCKECNKKYQKRNQPSKEQLIKDFHELKFFTKIGRKYNVSDNAVRKWFKSYDLSAVIQIRTGT